MSKILLIVSLALTPVALPAQTAEDHFHRGAQYYVFGEKTNAILEVVTGLRKFPDDEKLRAFAELLRKEQEKQQQQSQPNQDQKQDEKKQDSQEQNQQKQQAKQDQKDQPQPQSPENKDQQKQAPQQAKSSADQQKGKPEDQQQDKGAAQIAAHAMTQQEAKQLLDAQKGEEQFLQFRPPDQKEKRGRPLKDWYRGARRARRDSQQRRVSPVDAG